MKNGLITRSCSIITTLILAASLSACGTSSTTPDPGSNNSTLPEACDGPTSLMGVAEVVDEGSEDCAAWLDSVRGRVGRNSAGSFAVWSRRTADGVGLMVAANHTLGAGWYGPDGTAVERAFVDVTEREGIMRLNVPPADGTLAMDTVSPMFELFHPEIPAAENGNHFHDIRPRHDFYVAIVDGQRASASGGPAPIAGPMERELLPLYDPQDRTRAEPTYADVTDGELVMLMGYPQQGPYRELGAVSVGRVLSASEVDDALEALRQAGDEEGDIPYDPEAEFILEARAEAGMSGGGVFNTDGVLVGILVRASQADLGTQFVRAVRMTHVAADMNAAFEELSEELQTKLAPFMEQ